MILLQEIVVSGILLKTFYVQDYEETSQSDCFIKSVFTQLCISQDISQSDCFIKSVLILVLLCFDPSIVVF
jgi:hypothetical protein